MKTKDLKLTGRLARTRRAAAVAVGLAAAMLCLTATGQEVDLAGVQVWNCGYWETVKVGDYYATNYEILKLKPISLVGVRNGTFSGHVVLTGSNGPIRGLKAKATDLKQEGGQSISTARVRVRFPQRAEPRRSYAPPYRFDGLADRTPEGAPIIDPRKFRRYEPLHVGPVAMQPIWVTVHVPKDAAPGEYQGWLDIEAEDLGLKPMRVPIRLTVHDWQLPDSKDFSVQNLAWLSPERVAQYYGLPMWSDKHFELMGKSLELMLGLGSRQVQVNLVARYPSQDNAETMVIWVKQPDGSFKYDFTAFDGYMDLVAKTIGKPFPVRLNMWTVPRKDPPLLPQVRVLDPGSGQMTLMDQPAPIGSLESLKFWKPVLDAIRVRMEKRGWFDVTGCNWIEYCGGPTPKAVSMLHRIWPDGKWTDLDHGRRYRFKGEEKGVSMPVIAQSCVWNEGALKLRGYKGKLKPGIAICGHARGRHREWSYLWDIRGITEEQLMKGNHGVDPLGGDLWPLPDSRGRYRYGRWAAFALGPGNCTKAYLAPGPDGPIATERYEAFREGVQIAEAILFVQRALDAGKLDPKLTKKANAVLDARSKRMLDSWPKYDAYGHRRFNRDLFAKDAQARESELYATAAGAAKALGPATAKP